MKLLACFKIVPDLDDILEQDWTATAGLHVDTSYTGLVWNCFDECALEIMLRLSEASKDLAVDYKLSALTVGWEKHERFLKTLFALGFSEGIRICREDDEMFHPEQVAQAIARYVTTRKRPDVLFTGMKTSDASNGKVPYLVAEELHWRCLSNVVGVEPVDESHLKVTCRMEGGFLVQTVRTPCVLAVGNVQGAYLRIPTLKDRMTLGKKTVERILPEELGLYADKDTGDGGGSFGPHADKSTKDGVRLLALHAINRQKDTIRIEGDTPREKALRFYEDHLKKRLEQ